MSIVNIKYTIEGQIEINEFDDFHHVSYAIEQALDVLREYGVAEIKSIDAVHNSVLTQ